MTESARTNTKHKNAKVRNEGKAPWGMAKKSKIPWISMAINRDNKAARTIPRLRNASRPNPKLSPMSTWAALAMATLIAWSRISLGLHFPFDVAAGAVLGTVCGWAVVRLVMPRADPSLQPTPAAPHP